MNAHDDLSWDQAGTNGIESVEVHPLDGDGQGGLVELVIHLFHRIEGKLNRDNVLITRWGSRDALEIIGEPVEESIPNGSDNALIRLHVADPDDAFTYTVGIVEERTDPRCRPYWGFHLLYAFFDFLFRRPCPPPEPDCSGVTTCRPAPISSGELEINYLAKDYASFRRLMLDRLAQTIPNWTDRYVPDLGLTVVEVLAYVADHLSYYQDAVGTEAYLDTARKRVSVRRHARLVDYRLHEGTNARTWIHLEVNDKLEDLDLENIYFFTEPLNPTGQGKRPFPEQTHQLLDPAEADRVVFAPVVPRPSGVQAFRGMGLKVSDHWPQRDPYLRTFYPEHNRILFHVPQDGQVCLPRGTTTATLAKRLPHLGCGDVLIFEEIKDPVTGQKVDANPAHRHAVRLTKVVPGEETTQIEWFEQDALPFPLCIQSETVVEVSVARGNVILVDHGIWQAPEDLRLIDSYSWGDHADQGSRLKLRSDGEQSVWRYQPLSHRPLTHAAPFPDPSVLARVQASYLDEFRACLQDEQRWSTWIENLLEQVRQGVCLISTAITEPLRELLNRVPKIKETHPHPLTPWDCALRCPPRRQVEREELFDPLHSLAYGPARDALIPSPRDALPVVILHSNDSPKRWTTRHDLLGHAGESRYVVVEIDDEGLGHLRFDDETPEKAPPRDEHVYALYRTGNGSRGNVGIDKITGCIQLSTDQTPAEITAVRNPLPASGGTDPESTAAAKLSIPSAFRDEPKRAVTAEDYASIAARDERIQQAGAVARYTGSGTEMRVALDLKAETIRHYGRRTQRVFQEIEAKLRRFRRIGHDVRVVPARKVPVKIVMEVCLTPLALRTPVEAALRGVLGPGLRPDGRRSLLHPDHLTFGTPIIASALIKEAQAVDGVAHVRLQELRRQFEAEPPLPPDGILEMGALEIPHIVVSNLPGQRGLEFNFQGGR